SFFMETEVDNKTDKIDDFYEEVDKGHGRLEIRKCYVSSQLDWLPNRKDWKDLNTIIMIESSRELKEEVSVERRFYISSLATDAEMIAKAIREHWGVENKLHWVLDVTFHEDDSRVRKDHAPENMSLIRRWTINMLKTAQKNFKGISLKGLRKKAGWGDSTLDVVLQGDF
ncbi:unnamed protein product, partial [marine sediment metagenome]